MRADGRPQPTTSTSARSGSTSTPDACATSRAAGLHSVQDDIARLVPAIVALVYGQPDGIIGSPPCNLFSGAGKGTGRQLMEELHRAVLDAARGASDIVMARHRRELRRLLHAYLRETEGYKRSRSSKHGDGEGRPYARESTPIRRGDLRAEADRMVRNVSLVWQPARWAARLRPRWVALEQVPAVLPLWEAMARGLEVHGYRCWTGCLQAEMFAVPQTRRRAILLASLDGQPQPPEATHQRYVSGELARASEADLFGPGVLPWISMGEALGWNNPDDVEVSVDRGAGMIERYGKRRPRRGSEPAPLIRAGSPGCGPNLNVSLVTDTQSNATARTLDEPAPTIKGGNSTADRQWVVDTGNTRGYGGVDPGSRRNRVFPPGHKVNGDDLAHGRGGQKRSGGGHTNGTQRDAAVRVSVHEAAALQSFPADWPWQGSRSAIYRLIGNAIPPLLARVILQAAMAPTRRLRDTQPATPTIAPRGEHPCSRSS